MRRSRNSTRIEAVARAKGWLETVSTPTDETIALKQLGLKFCAHVASKQGRLHSEAPGLTIKLPSPTAFVVMSRDEVLELARALTLLPQETLRPIYVDAWQWSRTLGAVALSYARVGDLSVVAALVRVMACLRLCTPWLADCETYMIDQQHINGSFGLISSEVAMLQKGTADSRVQLRLTVEVLWALADMATVLDSDLLVHRRT